MMGGERQTVMHVYGRYPNGDPMWYPVTCDEAMRRLVTSADATSKACQRMARAFEAFSERVRKVSE